MSVDFSLPQDFGLSSPKKGLALPQGANGLVLHCCCAPCSTALLECLIFNHIKPVLFFYNPNIYPAAEYQKRLEEWQRLAKLLGLESITGDYTPKLWFQAVKGLELEPERGLRCQKCFELRLCAAALLAKDLGINLFATTLCTSRWKSKAQVDAAGFAAQSKVQGVSYWDQDWRKQGLINRRYELIKEIGFYNQNYCGCIYSLESSALKHNREISSAICPQPSHSSQNNLTLSDNAQTAKSANA